MENLTSRELENILSQNPCFSEDDTDSVLESGEVKNLVMCDCWCSCSIMSTVFSFVLQLHSGVGSLEDIQSMADDDSESLDGDVRSVSEVR